MARETTKQLICPACGVVLADATYRRWPPRLVVRSPEGFTIQPESVAVQLRREQSTRGTAAAGAAADEADARIAFLRRNLAELVFDLRCRSGHSVLRTMPQLARAVRTARGRWVELR